MSRLEAHFHDLDRQRHAAQLGMWVFLASEVLFFGALFVLYTAYRGRFPETFRAAAGHTDLVLGSVNTYVLVLASFLVAMAVGAVRRVEPERNEERGRRGAAGRRVPSPWARRASWLLAAAAVLGVLFLGLKGWEYARHFREGIYPGAYYRFEELPAMGAAAFFNLYYLMTGLHALHVLGGVTMLGWLSFRARRGRYDREWHTPLELGGMYWHFVDVVWLFLWPVFYLMR